MDVLAQAISAHQAGDLAGAERLYREVLAERSSHSAAGNLGVILAARGDFAGAEAAQRQAIALAPTHPNHRRHLGNLYMRWGRLDDAIAAFEALLALEPGPDVRVEAERQLGDAYLYLGRPEGWAFYDSRPERRLTPARSLSYPAWQGEPLAGKRLFVMGEQGLGDQIFAARYLAELDCDVTLACAPVLMRLFSQFPQIKLLPRVGRFAAPNHHYWTLPLSLPRWAAPAPAPYMRAPARGAGGIGVMWRGNATPDPGRSLPAAVAERLLALPGAMSLHPDDTGAGDLQDTAEIVAGLDFVVSVDTGVAHLAGALGKPGAVLLQHYPRDWRWRESEPGRSFWYPSLAVMRQPAPGDWDSLVDAVSARLARGSAAA